MRDAREQRGTMRARAFDVVVAVARVRGRRRRARSIRRSRAPPRTIGRDGARPLDGRGARLDRGGEDEVGRASGATRDGARDDEDARWNGDARAGSRWFHRHQGGE